MGTQSLSATMDSLKNTNDRFVGVVVDNNDPDKHQRIRIAIPGKLESSNVSDLPWVAPRHLSPFGVGDNYGVLRIPRIGSRVYVQFDGDDLSHGSYDMDVVRSTLSLPPELADNYPNRYGFVNPLGDVFYVDLTSGDAFFRRASGTGFTIDMEGSVSLVVAKDFTQVVKGNYNLSVEGNYTASVEGTMTTQVGGEVAEQLGANRITQIRGNENHAVDGSITTTCSKESHSGPMHVSGEVTSEGVSVPGHTHGGVRTGSGHTATPD